MHLVSNFYTKEFVINYTTDYSNTLTFLRSEDTAQQFTMTVQTGDNYANAQDPHGSFDYDDYGLYIFKTHMINKNKSSTQNLFSPVPVFIVS